MTREPWILATRNAGKLRELRALFADAGIDVVDLAEAGLEEWPEEEGLEEHDTFEGNALAKARYYSWRAAGRTVVADDSGLEVPALGGEPGVQSKRWSGRGDLEGPALDAANNALLLARLRDHRDWRARFVCAASWCAGSESAVVRGEVPGAIVTSRGGTRGVRVRSALPGDGARSHAGGGHRRGEAGGEPSRTGVRGAARAAARSWGARGRRVRWVAVRESGGRCACRVVGRRSRRG